MIARHTKIAALAATTMTAALIAYAGDVAVKLNVKVGLWEVTTTGKTQGDIPEQMLAQIPPERRAQMIAAIKASANRTHTYRQCMTTDKLSKGFDVQPSHENCQRSVVANSATDMTVKEQCSGDDGVQSVNVHFHADSSESVTGTVTAIVTRGGQSMNFDSNMQGKWLGSSCGDVKDVQVVR
jgi:hypothetical protein